MNGQEARIRSFLKPEELKVTLGNTIFEGNLRKRKVTENFSVYFGLCVLCLLIIKFLKQF